MYSSLPGNSLPKFPLKSLTYSRHRCSLWELLAYLSGAEPERFAKWRAVFVRWTFVDLIPSIEKSIPGWPNRGFKGFGLENFIFVLLGVMLKCRSLDCLLWTLDISFIIYLATNLIMFSSFFTQITNFLSPGCGHS
tara:strand:+ start:183 stop:590 length:408 start_codon:yes stop_codon:yes gene_type:complete